MGKLKIKGLKKGQLNFSWPFFLKVLAIISSKNLKFFARATLDDLKLFVYRSLSPILKIQYLISNVP
jgi:hypothetical protein